MFFCAYNAFLVKFSHTTNVKYKICSFNNIAFKPKMIWCLGGSVQRIYRYEKKRILTMVIV